MAKSMFVFPGQGSQKIGMLNGFAKVAIVRETLDEASETLGYDMWELFQNGPAERLNQTEFTQPAILAASLALWRLAMSSQLPEASLLAGHSLGEYSALVAAGSLNFSEALQLVQLRGQLMQDAVPEGAGAMAAVIGLEDDVVVSCCDEASGSGVVQAVNFNSPGQVVIAGDAAGVKRAQALCLERGAKRALPLPVSVPSHCALMKPAAEKLKQALDEVEIAKPVIPVIRNLDAELYGDADTIREGLYRQLFNPVLWTQTVQKARDMGVEAIFECGPGKVLCGLCRRIDKGLTVTDLETLLAPA